LVSSDCQTWYCWYFNVCPLKCVKCHSSELGSDGPSGVCKVSVGSGEVHGLMCQRLICHACQARFSVLHPGVIACTLISSGRIFNAPSRA